jgi:bifunctional polynucleotide phosphatase/kinase
MLLHILRDHRCFLFQGSVELAWHNNLYRAYARPASVVAREVRIFSLSHCNLSLIEELKPARPLIPYSALTGFAGAYEVPSAKEGFGEVREIPWMFEGSEEEQRHWSMWLQIDGK